MRFLHGSDLHLSQADAEYGFSVLDEILSLSFSSGASALVLSGDCFDSFADLKALYPRFKKAVEEAKGDFPVLAVSGNHDLLRGSGDIGRFDFGPRITFVHKALLRLRAAASGGACEFILVPYGADPRGDDPEGSESAEGSGLSGSPKVVVAHGALPELNWLGPESEEGEAKRSSLDSRSILSLSPDYVALGHIHEAQSRRIAGSLFAYPGSARVWRRGESGKRSLLCVEVGAGAPARCEKIELKSPGEYRYLSCELDDSGGIDSAGIESGLAGAGPADWIDLGFSGVAQRETALRQAMDACRASLSSRFRKVDAELASVAFLGEEAESDAAREFRQAWRERRGGLEEAYGAEAALKALQIGLSAIARAQEAGK
jgi:predicted phosphodiesterase